MESVRPKKLGGVVLAACAILAASGTAGGLAAYFGMKKVQASYREVLPGLAGKSVRVVMRHGYEPEGRIVYVRESDGVVVRLDNGDRVAVREAAAIKGLSGDQTRAVTVTVERSQVTQMLFLGVFGMSAAALTLVSLLWRKIFRNANTSGGDAAIALFV